MGEAKMVKKKEEEKRSGQEMEEKLFQFFFILRFSSFKDGKCSSEIKHSYRFNALTMRTLSGLFIKLSEPFICNQTSSSLRFSRRRFEEVQGCRGLHGRVMNWKLDERLVVSINIHHELTIKTTKIFPKSFHCRKR